MALGMVRLILVTMIHNVLTYTITADSISVMGESLTGEDIEINGMQITLIDGTTMTYDAEADKLLVEIEDVEAIFTKDSAQAEA